MSDFLPTVKIKDDRQASGFLIINESDFDPTKHARFDEPASEPGKTDNSSDGSGALNSGGSGGAETDETRDAVEIPDSWREMEFNARKSLAARVSPTPVGPKKEDVNGAIEAALLRRAEKAAAGSA